MVFPQWRIGPRSPLYVTVEKPSQITMPISQPLNPIASAWIVIEVCMTCRPTVGCVFQPVQLKVGTHYPYVRPGHTAVFFCTRTTGRMSGPYRPDVRPVGFTRTIPEALYDVAGDVIIHILHILRCYCYFNNAMGRTGNREKTFAFLFFSRPTFL